MQFLLILPLIIIIRALAHATADRVIARRVRKINEHRQFLNELLWCDAVHNNASAAVENCYSNARQCAGDVLYQA